MQDWGDISLSPYMGIMRVCSEAWNQNSTFYWLYKGDISIESEGL